MTESKPITITKTGVICVVRSGIWGAYRTLKKQQVRSDAKDQERVRGRKYLVDDKKIAPIRSVVGAARNAVCKKSLPTGIRSFYFIPSTMIGEVNEILEAQRTKFLEEVEKFISVYPSEVIKAKEDLGALFENGDYPSIASLRSRFYFEWNWKPFFGPDQVEEGLIDVEGFSSEMVKEQVKKAEAEIADTVEEWKICLVEQFMDLLNHMIDRLTPKEDGKNKVFHASSMANISEFLNTLPNFESAIGSTGLGEHAQKIKDLMAGKSADDLRKDDAIRQQIRNGFKSVTESLDSIMKDAPMRKLRLSKNDDTETSEAA